jgi:hypothetical protein
LATEVTRYAGGYQSGSGADWSNPFRMYASDSSRARLSQVGNPQTDTAFLSDFGFAIPEGMAPVRIVAETYFYKEFNRAGADEFGVQLFVGNVAVGAEAVMTNASPMLNSVEYLLSQTVTEQLPTREQVNAGGSSGLRVRLRAYSAHSLGQAWDDDYVRVVVTYDVAPPSLLGRSGLIQNLLGRRAI